MSCPFLAVTLPTVTRRGPPDSPSSSPDRRRARSREDPKAARIRSVGNDPFQLRTDPGQVHLPARELADTDDGRRAAERRPHGGRLPSAAAAKLGAVADRHQRNVASRRGGRRRA